MNSENETCTDNICIGKDTTVTGLVASTIESHHKLMKRMKDDSEYEKRVMSNRAKLALHIEDYHRKKGTLTESIKSRISMLKDKKDTAILMTAHQTNFMPYSGIIRKATLMHVIRKKLKEEGIESVEFFGIADQDMAGSWPWLNMTQLPSIFHKNGIMELTYTHSKSYETKIHAAVPKPNATDISGWRAKIGDWMKYSLKLIEDSKNPPEHEKIEALYTNMERLMSKLAESLYTSENFADFNASVLSKSINEGFHHDTLFAKYTECQHIFENEFIYLLDNITETEDDSETSETTSTPIAPFWYHCECLGKVSLTITEDRTSKKLTGKCPACGKTHNIILKKDTIKKDISAISKNISARARPMALVFFDGLGISMYVGGALANKCYLKDAKKTSDKLGTNYPTIAVWRPRDHYNGLAQLSCSITKKTICKDKDPEEKLTSMEEELETTLEQARTLDTKIREAPTITDKKKLISQKNEILKSHDLNTLSRNISTLKKIQAAESTYPSFIDYAVNIGLENTAKAWINYLENNGNLRNDITLKSILE